MGTYDISVPGLPDIPTPDLNPLHYLADPIKSIYQQVSKLVERLIMQTPATDLGKLQTYFNGSSYELAAVLSIAILPICIVLAMILRRKIKNALEAFVVLFALGLGSSLWFGACTTLIAFGQALADGAAGLYQPEKSHPGGDFFGIGSITNVLLAIFGLGFIVLFAGALIVIIFAYQIVNLMVIFLGLPSFALYPLGDRAKKWFKMLLSIALVGMAFGRPAAILGIELGEALQDHGPFVHTPLEGLAVYIYTLCSLLIALGVQFGLIAACYKGISAVEGHLTTETRGKVEAMLRRHSKVDVGKVRAEIGRTNRPMPVRVQSADPSVPQQAVGAAKKKVVGRLAAGVIAAQPELAPAVKMVEGFAHKKIDKSTARSGYKRKDRLARR